MSDKIYIPDDRPPRQLTQKYNRSFCDMYSRRDGYDFLFIFLSNLTLFNPPGLNPNFYEFQKKYSTKENLPIKIQFFLK